MKIYGFHPIREALRHRPREVSRLWVAEGRGGGRRAQVEELCQRHGVAWSETSRERLDELADGGAHNGFVAELSGPAGAASAARPAGGDPELVVLVEDIQDPRNLGALMRVCEGAGVGRLLIRDRGSAPVTPVVEKASAGAAEWLAVERITNSASTLRRLKKEGFWVYGTSAEGKPPWEIDLTGPVVLVFGGEEKGLRRLTGELCDELIGLPMAGRVESLNLATAASAVLYDAVRQRR